MAHPADRSSANISSRVFSPRLVIKPHASSGPWIFCWWHRVKARPTPWIAARQSMERKPQATYGTVGFQSFDGIDRAAWLKAAGVTEPRRQNKPVATDRKNQEPDEESPHARIRQRLSPPESSTSTPSTKSSSRNASARAHSRFARACARFATSASI